MATTRELIRDNLIYPSTFNDTNITTIGVVTASDESNNTCDIRYVDKTGYSRNRKDVVVRLYGNGADWFPAVNDTVVIEDTGETVVVVARHVGNYAMDVRSKRQLRQDCLSDETGCQEPGGSIM